MSFWVVLVLQAEYFICSDAGALSLDTTNRAHGAMTTESPSGLKEIFVLSGL